MEISEIEQTQELSSECPEVFIPIFDGMVFVGDHRFKLASPEVKLIARDNMRNQLRILLFASESRAFVDAIQQVIHSNRFVDSPYPQSDLIPKQSNSGDVSESTSSSKVHYFEKQLTGVKYLSVNYLDLGDCDATNTRARYLDVRYASIHYAHAKYATVDRRRLGDGKEDEMNQIVLTITGRGRNKKRRVLTVRGVVSFNVRRLGAEFLEVVLELKSTFSLQRLVWLIEGH